MKTFTLFSVWLTAGCLLCLYSPLSALAGNEFIAIAYHDVVDQRHELTADAVTLDNLIDHFEWLKVSGYQPVSIDDLKAARAGTNPLPDKAILLCWDDGYTSFYTHVLPLLKAYQYPAVLALVGSWMAPGPEEMVQYGEQLVPRKKFMTWQQLKEVAETGLVEIASHSNNLHTALLADRSGDKLPAAIVHTFDPVTGTYETDQQFRERIRTDLQKSSDLMLKHLGFRPRVLVWPFGQYNTIALESSADIGMAITLTLNPVPGDTDHLHAIGRIYPTRNPDLKTFRYDLDSWKRPPVHHFIRVDSHDLLEPSPDEETHFNTFLDRVKNLNPNMVVLDPIIKDNGTSKALFTNTRFPVAQNRLMRLSWHTSKRAGAAVFLWLSSELFTPRDEETAETITRFFSDMGKSAPGEGLIVDNPELVQALLQEAETNSNHETGVRFWNPDKQRRARQAMSKDAANQQISLPFQALESFQQWQPFQEVSLVIAMDHFLNMELNQFNFLLNFFDFLIIDTGANGLRTRGTTLHTQLERLDEAGYLRKCSFLLSAEAQGNSLASELHRLPTLNIINWGYQFDRFLENSPPAASIRRLLSKGSFPYPLRR